MSKDDSAYQAKNRSAQKEGLTKKNSYFSTVAATATVVALHLWDAAHNHTAKKNRQRADEHLIAAATDKMARYTGWLVAATIFSAITAAATLYVIHAQSVNEEASQRAFVYMAGLAPLSSFMNQDTKKTNVQVTVVATNGGNTPTIHLTFEIKCIPSVKPRSDAFSDLSKSKVKRTPNLIGPKASSSAICTFLPEELMGIKDRKAYAYIVGRYDYEDVFAPGKIHRTEFEYQVSAIAFDQTMTNIEALQVSAVGTHNCADDDCPLEPK